MVRKERQILSAPLLEDGISPARSTWTKGTGVTAIEHKALVPKRIRITLSGFVISITAALDYAGTKLMDLPDSNMLILGCETDLELVKGEVTNGLEAATDINMGVGTAVASNATLSSTMQNVVEVDALTASDASPAWDAQMADNSTTVPPIVLADAAANALYLNLAAAITADDTLTVSGTIDLYVLDIGNLTS